MNLIDAVNKITAPLRSKVENMIKRAVVEVIDDTKKVQTMQLTVGALGAVRSDVERLQDYGFTSVPLKGAEAAVVFVGGRGDHGLVVAVGDRRYRLKGLVGGEVALYTDQGDKIVMKRGGTIEVTSSTKVHLITPLVECSTDLKVLGKLDVTGDATMAGKLDVTGNITSDDTITATTDVVGGGKSLATHTHPVSLTGGTTASSCTAGGATGTTAGSVTSGAPS